MELETGAISRVVQEVWSSMLGVDVVDLLNHEPDPRKRGALLSIVKFMGAWQGTVSMNCSPELARQLAAGMFGTEPEQLSEEEIRDALGELVNIIGGNLKQLLPKPCNLSLPAVSEDASRNSDPEAGRLVSQANFAFENELFRVALSEGPPAKEEEITTQAGEPCKS